MNYFVTGATGFIGKFLLEKLLAREDAKVHVLVRKSSAEKFEAMKTRYGASGSKLIPIPAITACLMASLLDICMIEPTVVFSSLDSFFGGFGRGVGQLPSGRLFTPTETRIINMILDVFFRSLKEAWGPVLEIDCEQVSSEINPQFAQIADENDLVIMSRFDTEGNGGVKGFVDLVYPYSALKPLRDLLRNRVQADGSEESDQKWRKELSAAVGDAELEIQVLLGQITADYSKVKSLKEGDLLFFNKPELASVLVGGLPSFEGQVGMAGPQVALRIDHSINPETI